MIEVEETSVINDNSVIVRMKVPEEEREQVRESEEWKKILASDIGRENQFRSLHIDLEKKIFLLNGKPMGNVTELRLEACGMHWSLALSKDERYEAPIEKHRITTKVECVEGNLKRVPIEN